MKAEPESRIEKGHDIKFSIDDLAAKTEPEPWDGKFSPAHHTYCRSTLRLTFSKEYAHIQVCHLAIQPCNAITYTEH